MSLVFLGVGGGGVSGDLATDLRVDRIPGMAKSLVRFPVAVSPDLPANQAFNVEGAACQVYRLTDRWRFCIALVDGSSPSWPRTSSALKVSLGAGTTPAEAGTYPSLDLSGMKLVLHAAETTFEATLADAVHEDVVAPIGPGHRGQVGPDLLRRKHYLLDLKRAGVVGEGTETTDRCTVADVHVTTRVDMDLAIVEILWTPGRWRSTNNPFQTNPSCGGRVYFEKLTIPTSSLPGGYLVDWFAAHPFNAQTVDDVELISAMPEPDECHAIPATSQYAVRFVVYNPATVTAQQAQAALRYRDRGFPVSGPLSAHHVHAFGPHNDLWIDYQAWRLGPNGEEVQWRDHLAPNTDTWQRFETLGLSVANDIRGLWATGEQGVTKGNLLLSGGARMGWFHGLRDSSTGGAGGVGVYGSTFPLQATTYFLVNTTQVDALTTRLGLGMIDLEDGRCLNDTKLAENNSSSWVDLGGGTPGMAGRCPYMLSAGLILRAWLHPHFAQSNVEWPVNGEGQITDNPRRWPASGNVPVTYLMLAPEDRAWSTPPSGKSCPYLESIDWQADIDQTSWSPFDLAHMSRARTPIIDGIWLLDDPIAHRLLEEVASTRAMLAYARHRTSGYMRTDYHQLESCFPEIAQREQAPPNTGFSSFQGVPRLVRNNYRNEAWALDFACAYYCVATEAERARIHPAQGAGVSWFRSMADYLARTLLRSGLGMRADAANGQPNPNPWSNPNMPPVDLALRTGRLPNGSETPDHYSASLIYMGCFMAGALRGLVEGPLQDDPPRVAALEFQLEHAPVIAAIARATDPPGNPGGRRAPYWALTSQGFSGILDPPTPRENYLAGVVPSWNLLKPANPPPGPPYRTENFSSWSAAYGYLKTGDPSFFDVACLEMEVPEGDELALLNRFLDGGGAFQVEWANNSSSFRNAYEGELLWHYPLVAELIHRRFGRTT